MPRPNALGGNFKLLGPISPILATLLKTTPQNRPRIDDLTSANTLDTPILRIQGRFGSKERMGSATRPKRIEGG